MKYHQPYSLRHDHICLSGGHNKKVEQIKIRIAEVDAVRLAFFNEYSSELDRTYTSLNSKLNQSLSDLYDQINKNLELSPLFNDFSSISKIKLSIYSLFSKKYKNVKSAKTNLIQTYNELVLHFNKYALFEFRNENGLDEVDYKRTLNNISQLKTGLKNWWLALPEEKRLC